MHRRRWKLTHFKVTATSAENTDTLRKSVSEFEAWRCSRRDGEKLREAGVNTMHNTSPACDSRSAGLAECGVRTVKEKGHTLVCYARELHGVTVGKSHVSLLWCVRFAAQIISRSHRGTDGMTGYRRAYGRSRMPRRYVPWSEKVFVEATWVRGFSSESRMNLK